MTRRTGDRAQHKARADPEHPYESADDRPAGKAGPALGWFSLHDRPADAP